MMTRLRSRAFIGVALAYLLCLPFGAFANDSDVSTIPPDTQRISTSVARLLQQGHYTQQKIDRETARKVLEAYIESLDYNHLFLTQNDIDRIMASYGDNFDRYLLRGDLSPAFTIFNLYKSRVTARVADVKELTAKPYSFDSERKLTLNRQEVPWPKDNAEAEALWSKRIEGELLSEKLNEHAIDPPQKVINRRYDQLLRNVQEMDGENVVKMILSALAQTYDPHSEYLSASDLENFEIQMRLSLVGVGAVLRSEDGYAKILEVVPGGPADRDGRLKVNDRVVAVAQGNNDFEDVVDMKLDKVVEKIRGKKGTVVRLQVIPGASTDPSKREIIDIQRDKVEIKDQEAKAEVIDFKQPNGQVIRLGWITLPMFYADMGRKSASSRSTTEDVLALLRRLKQEGIQGLVMDLRNDGGGSLDEAIRLTGLFIPEGPVVQSKDSNGRITVSEDTDPTIQYSGPMVVLTNRLSASASEIFAAALQDYGRAVIVGDERTFGKGTVQTMLEIGKFMPLFSLGSADAGALKLTIQKFYRVKGGSTQQHGVESDIVLPSLTDTPQIGETALKRPLPYDEVPPAKLAAFGDVPVFLDELREHSKQRVDKDPDFAYLREDAQRLKERIKNNSVSLNETQRRKELKEEKDRLDQRNKERTQRKTDPLVAYSLKLDEVNNPKLTLVSNKPKKDDVKDELIDRSDVEKDALDVSSNVSRKEALNILSDLIELQNARKTVSIGDRPE